MVVEDMDGSGATQNASEMAEATQIAKQVHRCEKGETDGVARLRGWRDGVTVALGRVWCRKMQRLVRDGIKVPCEKRARVACKRF